MNNMKIFLRLELQNHITNIWCSNWQWLAVSHKYWALTEHCIKTTYYTKVTINCIFYICSQNKIQYVFRFIHISVRNSFHVFYYFKYFRNLFLLQSHSVLIFIMAICNNKAFSSGLGWYFEKNLDVINKSMILSLYVKITFNSKS